MLPKPIIEKHLKNHKKIYREKISLLTNKVYDLIESGVEGIVFELSSFSGGYSLMLGDFTSLSTTQSLSNQYLLLHIEEKFVLLEEEELSEKT